MSRTGDTRTPESDAPDAAAGAHSRRLEALIRKEAQGRGGLLPFDRYMELALYAPGLGYYVSGTRKFGPQGDFVTAPELSPLFGRCIANQCREVLEALGGADLLEFGAGSGVLAAEVLATLEGVGVLPNRYLILELSPELRERQRSLLAERVPRLLERVSWLDGLPGGFRGVVLANEVLDAMPVHRFRVDDSGSAAEIFVRSVDGRWEELAAEPQSPGLEAAVRELQSDGLAVDAGYASEINLRLCPWLAALAEATERGLVLLIDYGYPRREYYQADRSGGTLMCHYRHRAGTDPYRHVGLRDITAHVDFSALAAGGRAAGFESVGYTTQAHFLIGCGLDRLLAETALDDGSMDLLLGAKQLVLPAAMGERFQVLGLAKGLTGPWCGFSVRDLSGRL
ncbi:MAG: SAM-dependent methyltransferase [Pseudomonadota bacterium]|nr:SAM-dependent methyltransferase [Pseudomonadota bacterium]